MTKYILHGGNTRVPSPDNESFFREMTLGIKGKALVLLNYFSREEKEFPELFEQDKKRILEYSESKDLEFEIAKEDVFEEQLKRAKVMYMRGGKTKKLLEKMKKLDSPEELFAGKIIVGSSAGAYVLSKYYWKHEEGEIGQGLGILNLKVYCHYHPEDLSVLGKMTQFEKDIPLLVLPEGKWQIFYK